MVSWAPHNVYSDSKSLLFSILFVWIWMWPKRTIYFDKYTKQYTMMNTQHSFSMINDVDKSNSSLVTIQCNRMTYVSIKKAKVLHTKKEKRNENKTRTISNGTKFSRQTCNAACNAIATGMLVVLFNSIMACLNGIKSVSCFHCHELWPLIDHTKIWLSSFDSFCSLLWALDSLTF